MKAIRIWALVGILGTNGLVFSSTLAEGWYGGLGGGFSSMNTQKFSSPTPPFLLTIPAWTFFSFNNGNIRHGVGGDFFGQVGTRICNFRFEGELLFNYAPISRFSVGGRSIVRHVTPLIPVRIKADTTLGAGLFNAYYDFYDEENDPTWVPYIGLGIGYAHINNSVTFSANETHPAFQPSLINPNIAPFTPLDPFNPILNPLNPINPINSRFNPVNFKFTTHRTSSAPIGQIILGLSYYSSDTLAFSLDFRYLATHNTNKLGSRVSLGTLNFSFNYWFHDEA